MKRASTFILLLAALLLAALPVCAAVAPAADDFAAKGIKKNYNMPYWIEVDLTHQLVIVYNASTNLPVRTMLCSSGKNNKTPRGEFYTPTTPSKEWTTFETCYIRYGTIIKRPYWFHSILYERPNVSTLKKTSWRDLGRAVSSGCIRLTPIDAQWINYNCKRGTYVKISKFSGTEQEKARRKALRSQIRAELDALGVKKFEPTLQPTPTPVPPTLSMGANHSRVEKLEKRLQSLGFFPGKPNTTFDEATRQALMAYQKAAGLTADGVATPELQQKIEKDTATIGCEVTVKYGDSYLVCKAIATRLKALGYLKSSYKPSNKFDSNLRSAVKKFQQAAGLPANGVADPQTQRAIFDQEAPEPTPTPVKVLAKVAREGYLTLRERADASSRSLVRMPTGATVVVNVKGVGDDGWSKVMYKNKTGYVKNQYLAF